MAETEQTNYLKRTIDRVLIEWKAAPNRKPLLLRGARQVGKSSAVKHLSKQFQYFIEVNFEEQRQLHKLFEGDLSPDKLCENISVIFNTPIIPGKTLLFFDEIQSCIPAISSLRFFYEKMPQLHLIAAGSLLEFALSEIPSYGVGRIRSAFIFPFSFDEFLVAAGEEKLLKIKQQADADHPLTEPIHLKLCDYLKRFLILGGMPEVVSKYVTHNKLNEVQTVLDDLVISYKADFAKYKKRVPAHRILEVFNSVIQQNGGKFILTKAATQSNIKQVKEALDLLIKAGLIIPVTHSGANGIPLGADSDSKKQKMLLLDTGIFQRIAGLNLSHLLLENDFNSINKGAIAELFVGLEILKAASAYAPAQLYYWQRETKSSNAEVDYLIQLDDKIIPIEVKSSGKGSMQSMYQFIKEKQPEKGIRISLENFGRINGIEIYPLYAVANLLEQEG